VDRSDPIAEGAQQGRDVGTADGRPERVDLEGHARIELLDEGLERVAPVARAHPSTTHITDRRPGPWVLGPSTVPRASWHTRPMDATGPWQNAARGADLLRDGRASPTIFARMSARAAELGAMNLGQGFPDTDPPPAVAEAAVAAIRAGANQYPPGPGTPELRAAIARHQERFYGLSWDPAREVLVTTGATEAIAASILALVRPGDEVLTLEPYYDSYAAMIALAGGVHRTVPLTVENPDDAGARSTDAGPGDAVPAADADTADGSPGATIPAADARARAHHPDTDAATGPVGDLRLGVDPAALRAAITDATRLILVNSPHNPTGIILSPEALTAIVEGAAAHDAIIVSDEVYEHLVLDDAHTPIATLPGARERTITIGSAGKTLSVTGWKIGWITAPSELVTAVTGVKQWLTYTSGAPFQGAVATGLDLPDEEFDAIADDLRRRRDGLLATLRGIGARVSVPAAGYFVVADLSGLGEADAAALCERLPEEAGVVAIPVPAFCRDEADGGHASRFASLVRFAFCKDDATMTEAARRLEAWAAERGGKAGRAPTRGA